MVMTESNKTLDQSQIKLTLGPEGCRSGQLRAVILLGGLLSSAGLGSAIGRSVLDLPLSAGKSVLDLWCDQVAELAQHIGAGNLPMRVLVNAESKIPKNSEALQKSGVSIERDPEEYRGTAGVLRDVTAEYGEADTVLVANAALVMTHPLWQIAQQMARVSADVVLMANQDESPSGVMLLRVGILRSLPDVGFVDFKEQALPDIAKRGDVVALQEVADTCGIRTLADYISVLRGLQMRAEGMPTSQWPYAEQWRPSFNLVEPGSNVSSDASIYDSVVLAGATVEAGAVLVRSVVCAGARVRRGEMIVDEVVSAGGRGAKS